MSILIVDDDAGIRQLLSLFLTHKGVANDSATNGLEALNQLQHAEHLPELILLDLMMPVMDGASFREAQRSDLQLAAIPVVVMSAAENLDSQAPALTADAYLPKPIDFDLLTQLIEQLRGPTRERAI
jgi:CheY-like chemotaxis protein